MRVVLSSDMECIYHSTIIPQTPPPHTSLLNEMLVFLPSYFTYKLTVACFQLTRPNLDKKYALKYALQI